MNILKNHTSKHAGLQLDYLVLLAQGLPHLHIFQGEVQYVDTEQHVDDGKYIYDQLPLSLPAAAPRLTRLNLGWNELVGRLPQEWWNWTSIEALDLSFNELSGTLPDS